MTTRLAYIIAYLQEEQQERDWEREFDANDTDTVRAIVAEALDAYDGGAR